MILQSISLGTIIFLVSDNALNIINEVEVIGLDTQILLSILFLVFLLIVEYLKYTGSNIHLLVWKTTRRWSLCTDWW